MSEQSGTKKIFSLSEVARSIEKTLSERYSSAFWVTAEMNKLNLYKHSGHCYPELVEKKDGKIVAQFKSTLWRADYLRINAVFQDVLKEPLKDGIKILFLARITFDAAHGLSLSIIDIDPNYTLGDLEREKLETIAKLKAEDLYARNKQLPLPQLPQRIAIISVETSKGYVDFLKVIEQNPWGYKFFHMLFPSLLQGDKAIDSIIQQLMLIEKVKHHFDIIAIIRGGGGDVGLSCYNNFRLASAIANSSLPVLTGIGHATNETVCEMIAHYNAITPTKLGEFILQQFHNFSVPVNDAKKFIADKALRILMEERTHLKSEVKLFRSMTENLLLRHNNDVQSNIKLIRQVMNFRLRSEKNNIDYLKQQIHMRSAAFVLERNRELVGIERNVINMSPALVLKRGYTITLHKGAVIKSFEELQQGDAIETITSEGVINSAITSIKKNNNAG